MEHLSSSSRQRRALALFRKGYNCAQAVAYAFAGDPGIDRDNVLRAACGFGGGMGHRQEVCGAVIGGILVLGLLGGRAHGEPKSKSETTYTMVQEFMRRFEARHGTSTCRELLGGCDLNTPEGHAAFHASGYREARCEAYVRDAVGILEDLTRETTPFVS